MSMQGRIPLYNRGALARESGGDVNVPDTAGDFTRVSNMLFNTAEQNIAADNRRYAQLEAARLKAEKEKRDMSDDIAAERALLDWENSAYQDLEQQKQQNFANPWSVYDGIDGRINESIDSYASQISNPDVADKFRKRAATSTRAIQNNVRTWATNQDSQNIMTNLQSGLESLYTRAGNAASLNEVAGLISQSDSFTLNAASAIGPEQAKKMADSARRQIAENFIYSRIDNSPNEIASYINGGVFDGIFDDKEQHTILGNAQRIVEKRQREAEDAAEAQANWKAMSFLPQLSSGTATLSEVNNAIAAEKMAGGTGSKSRIKFLEQVRNKILDSGKYPYAGRSKLESADIVRQAFYGVKVKTTKAKEDGAHLLGESQETSEYSYDDLTKEHLTYLTDVFFQNAYNLSDSQKRMYMGVLNQLSDQYSQDNKLYQDTLKYREAQNADPKKHIIGSHYDLQTEYLNIPQTYRAYYSDYINLTDTMDKYISMKVPKSVQPQVRSWFFDAFAENYESEKNQPNFSQNKYLRFLCDQVDRYSRQIQREAVL